MSGYEPFLTRVMPELVMQRKRRPSAGSRLRGRGGPPAIEIVGLDEAEGEALLRELYRRYAPLLPINDPTRMPLTRGRVADSFWYLSTRVYGLSGPTAYRLPIRFPRFALGMMAYVWAERNDRPDLEQIARGHEWMREELRKQHDENPQQVADGQLLTDLQGYLASAIGGRIGAALAAVSALVRLLLARPRPDRVALRWWGKALNTPPGTFSLHEAVAAHLFRTFRSGTDQRGRSADQLLAAAFLADIDAHYGLRRRLNRDLLPVILLPAHTPAAHEFLDTLLRAYGVAFPRPPRKRTVTRPVIVAVGGDGTGGPPPRPLAELESYLNIWTLPVEGDVRERWVLRVTAEEAPEAAPEAARTEGAR
jgi:hypothetical protein